MTQVCGTRPHTSAKRSAYDLVCNGTEAGATREFLTRIGDKWSIALVVLLARAPGHKARFSELKRSVEGISQTMLTSTLRNLERDGMVTRKVFPEIPPKVVYHLTPLGLSVIKPMQGLVDWVAKSWGEVKRSRAAYDFGRKK